MKNYKPVEKDSKELTVAELENFGRNASGKISGGIVTFSDGKVWTWHRSTHDGSFYFTIDSGVPSQWSHGNSGRQVSYPKRVDALKKKLSEIQEL